MNRTIGFTIASAMLLALGSATPVFAQSAGGNAGGGSGGDNSTVTSCKTSLDREQLAVTAARDPAKQAAANQELTAAKDAMAKGDQTACLAHLQKIDAALK